MIAQVESPVLERMRQRYGSFETPYLGFVAAALDEKPYAAVLDALAGHFKIEDDTDPNDDVSFVWRLWRGRRRWLLQLSMVGPYAVLMRISTWRDMVKIVAEPDVSIVEREMLDILAANGLRMIDKGSLEQPVPMNLHNTDPKNVRLYQALFTDSDRLPWDAR